MRNRKRNRMVGYDYSQNNLYFVTSCVKNMECCFGEVVLGGTGRDLSVQQPDKNNPDKNNPDKNNLDKNISGANESEMILNEYGIIANNQFEWLESQYLYIELHTYKVMPNHIHAIIEIDSLKVNTIQKIDEKIAIPENIKIKSLSQIMGAYKTTSSNLIHQAGYDAFAWHRSFHDHIIRDEKSYRNIMNYIQDNPNRWLSDKFYKK